MTRFYSAQGHGRQPSGNFDPGATSGQIREHELVERLTVFIDRANRRCRVDAILEQCPDPVTGNSHSPNFAGSRDRANKAKVAAALEDHFDWSGAPEGGFGISHTGSVAGKRLADAIRQAWSDHGLTVRRNYSRSNLGFLSGTRMPAVIWENGKVRPYTDDELEAMAEARVDGVCRFLGIPYVPPAAHDPDPAPERTDGIDYVRFLEPRRYELIRTDTVLWDFGAARHADMTQAATFGKGRELTIVGKAIHPTGSIYLMTAWSFADADVSGAPFATTGFNQVDLEAIPEPDEPAPQPEPTPEPEPEPDPAPQPGRVARLETLTDGRGVIFDLMAPLHQPDGTRPLNRDRGRIIVGPFQRANGLYNYSDSSVVQAHDLASDPHAQQDGHVPYLSSATAAGKPGAARWFRPHATFNVQVPFSMSLTARVMAEPAGGNDGLKVAFLHESNESMWLAQILRKDRRANLFQEDRPGNGPASDTAHGKVWDQTSLQWLVGKLYRIDVETDIVRNPITGNRKILIEVFVDGIRILRHKTKDASRTGQVGIRGDNTWLHIMSWVVVQR